MIAQLFTTDVGQNQLWTTQFLEVQGQHQMLTSGGFGTMGYGFPAALGAQMGNQISAYLPSVVMVGCK